MKIQHVQLSIPVGSLETARQFYLEVLGLPEIVRPAGLTNRPGLWLSLAHNQEIHLAEDAQANPSSSKAHVALSIDSSDAIEARLEKAGTAIEKRTQHEGGNRIHFRDPFGNRIEIIFSRVPQKGDEDFPIEFPKGDLERILAEIESRVQQFLDGDQKKLTNWLYRLDVAEKSVKAIWDNVAQKRWARRISELIFQRELQKYFSRRDS
jgi:catechol 2,3-dioxygenase-like lactoylglutathione lyase family enzyme